MLVYKYHEITKEFLYSEEAIADPLETEIKGEFVPLIPANATLKEPPQKEGFAAVYVGGEWELQEDNRGKEYWLPGDEYGTPARTMKELGELPEGAVFETPEKPFEMLKTEKFAEVDQWTANKITGGFISSASGEAVTYDSDKDTQLTMQGIALNVNTELFAEKYPDGCPVRGYAEGASEKTIYWLSAAQVLAWCADLSMHIGYCKQLGWEKQAAVQAATTKEELESIVL